MNIDSIENLKATKNSLKASVKGIKVREFEGITFGSESEYDARGVVAGVDAIITDVGGLLRAPKRFLQCSNHSDRVSLNKQLTNIKDDLDDENLKLACSHIEALKPILRGYGIRYTDKRLNEFIDRTNELQKKIQTLSELLSDSKDAHAEILETTKITQSLKEKIEGQSDALTGRHSVLEELIAKSENTRETVITNFKTDKANSSEIEELLTKMNSHAGIIDTFSKKISTFEEIYEGRQDFDEKLKRLSEIAEEGEESSNKINLLYIALTNRKKDFDTLYQSISGYDYEDEDGDGEPIHIDGLKDDLEKSYIEINGDIDLLKKSVIDLDKKSSEDYEKFVDSQKSEFKKTVESWVEEHKSISNKVKRLLPGALTIGLSHAFSEKRTAEIKEGEKLRNFFTYAIIGLVVISIIPFAINVYLFTEGKSLESIIFDMPRMAFSILPLYIPVLWLAYSSSKKVNLSKRLVEEYTHKEVLSKTFESLSSQIEDIEDFTVSSELKTKLLYNILEVSSENPGKLITDYNKSDHPLIDALDKSAKLNEVIDKMSKIPGISKLSKILETKSNRILKDQEEGINTGLDTAVVEKSNNKNTAKKKAED